MVSSIVVGKVYEHHTGKVLHSAANLLLLTALVNCDAMMVSCQVSVLQLVSHHVVKNSGNQFKNVSCGPPESGWPSSDSSWQCYYILGTTAKLSMPFQVHSS